MLVFIYGLALQPASTCTLNQQRLAWFLATWAHAEPEYGFAFVKAADKRRLQIGNCKRKQLHSATLFPCALWRGIGRQQVRQYYHTFDTCFTLLQPCLLISRTVSLNEAQGTSPSALSSRQDVSFPECRFPENSESDVVIQSSDIRFLLYVDKVCLSCMRCASGRRCHSIRGILSARSPLISDGNVEGGAVWVVFTSPRYGMHSTLQTMVAPNRLLTHVILVRVACGSYIRNALLTGPRWDLASRISHSTQRSCWASSPTCRPIPAAISCGSCSK